MALAPENLQEMEMFMSSILPSKKTEQDKLDAIKIIRKHLSSNTSEIPNLEQKTIKEYVKCLLVQTNIETQSEMLWIANFIALSYKNAQIMSGLGIVEKFLQDLNNQNIKLNLEGIKGINRFIQYASSNATKPQYFNRICELINMYSEQNVFNTEGMQLLLNLSIIIADTNQTFINKLFTIVQKIFGQSEEEINMITGIKIFYYLSLPPVNAIHFTDKVVKKMIKFLDKTSNQDLLHLGLKTFSNFILIDSTHATMCYRNGLIKLYKTILSKEETEDGLKITILQSFSNLLVKAEYQNPKLIVDTEIYTEIFNLSNTDNDEIKREMLFVLANSTNFPGECIKTLMEKDLVIVIIMLLKLNNEFPIFILLDIIHSFLYILTQQLSYQIQREFINLMKPEGEKIINYMKEHCEDPIKFKASKLIEDYFFIETKTLLKGIGFEEEEE